MISAARTQGAMAPLGRENKQQLQRRRRTKAVRARRRGEYVIGVLMAGLVMAGLVIAWIYYAELMLTPPPPPTPAPGSFEQTRLGRVVVPISGLNCREYSFDNVTGLFGADKRVRCDEGQIAGTTHGLSASFESYKKAFGKK
jgi:hypothetical protein